MPLRSLTILLLTLLVSLPCQGRENPDWSEGATIRGSRENPYALSAAELAGTREAGLRHTLQYPVDVSGVYIPWRPLRNFLNDRSTNPVRSILQAAFSGLANIRHTDDLFALIGLHRFPTSRAEGSDDIPASPHGEITRMGATLLRRQGVDALTVSCAACHSSNLFGKKILGLTNRFPKANEFFTDGKKIVRLVSPALFRDVLGASAAETDLYRRLRIRLASVGTKKPAAPGLDTSLSQVALSLAQRGDDEYASFDRAREKNPKAEPLRNFVADSKPAVWWNLKYKNRWLSDGSVVSGNPIYTNILWNEIGRGTDLRELQTWLDQNSRVIEELTTAVFGTQAPRITDFFPADRIHIERAKRGEVSFNRTCAKCHGVYTKGWTSLPASTPLIEQLRTTHVAYPEKTRVINVGTDSQRREGMISLEKGLNPLAISKLNGIVIKTQNGYVPPPLVGIWARFPYFHNNSVPNLCALLTVSRDRPVTYWSGEAVDKKRDYDSDCAGYPVSGVPDSWKKRPEHLFDTRKPGLGNGGHDEKIFLKDGVEIFSQAEKMELIEFLKTL